LLKKNHIAITLGAFKATHGKTQLININELISSNYTLTKHNAWNALFGLSLLRDWKNIDVFPFSYGISGFYLPKTSVSGEIIQANLFNNLGYSYDVSNIPIYAIGKTYISLHSNQQIALDIGVGPNVMQINHYHEWRINPMTRPDNAFKSNMLATLSATMGIAYKINNVFGKAPMECGYRFFYLGSGNLKINNNQYTTQLSTGSNYANAITCALII